MLRIAICDDMPIFLRHVESLLTQWPERPDNLLLDSFEDADSLLAAHHANPYDIIFLDILMPLLNGIDAAREIRQLDKNVKIVFLTSSAEFGVDSYTVKANNYLLKPVDADRLFSCLNELTEELMDSPKTIVIKCAKALQRVQISNIEYLEAQNKHVLFAFHDGTSVYSVEPLYIYEEQLTLSDGFFKCSRSYIVNMHHIDTYTTKEVRMRSGYRISISRSCQSEFEAAYFETMFGKAGDR